MKMADKLVDELREHLKPYFPEWASRFLLMGAILLFAAWIGLTVQVMGEWRRHEIALGMAVLTSMAWLLIAGAVGWAATIQAYREYRRATSLNATVQFIEADRGVRQIVDQSGDTSA